VARKILIVCNSFPPKSGIGGRRWVKFAKSLQQEGHQIAVMSRLPNPAEALSQWQSDLEALQIDHHEFYSSVYDRLDALNYSLRKLNSLRFKLSNWVKKLFVKGDYTELSIGSESSIRSKLSKLAKDFGPDVVIVSGAPFRLCYYLQKHKHVFSPAPLIVDFRDPWTRFNEEWSFGKLSKKRQEEELAIENEVFQADAFSFAPGFLMDYCVDKYNLAKEKVLFLPNCFDPEDYPEGQEDSKKEEISLVYSGTLYGNLVEPVLSFIRALKAQSGRSIRVHFFGDLDLSLKRALELEENLNVEIHGFVDRELALNAVKNFDFGLIFLLKNYESAISTKMLDYWAMGKKSIVIGEEGLVSQLFANHNLGVFIKLNEIENSRALIESYRNSDLFCLSIEDFTKQYSLNMQTEHLNQFIESTLA